MQQRRQVPKAMLRFSVRAPKTPIQLSIVFIPDGACKGLLKYVACYLALQSGKRMSDPHWKSPWTRFTCRTHCITFRRKARLEWGCSQSHQTLLIIAVSTISANLVARRFPRAADGASGHPSGHSGDRLVVARFIHTKLQQGSPPKSIPEAFTRISCWTATLRPILGYSRSYVCTCTCIPRS